MAGTGTLWQEPVKDFLEILRLGHLLAPLSGPGNILSGQPSDIISPLLFPVWTLSLGNTYLLSALLIGFILYNLHYKLCTLWGRGLAKVDLFHSVYVSLDSRWGPLLRSLSMDVTGPWECPLICDMQVQPVPMQLPWAALSFFCRCGGLQGEATLGHTGRLSNHPRSASLDLRTGNPSYPLVPQVDDLVETLPLQTAREVGKSQFPLYILQWLILWEIPKWMGLDHFFLFLFSEFCVNGLEHFFEVYSHLTPCVLHLRPPFVTESVGKLQVNPLFW